MSTVTRYVCPGCAARVKTPVPVTPGRHIKCPRCQKLFPAPAVAPPPAVATAAAPQAAGSSATPQAAAPATQQKETKLAAATVKETKLASSAKQTKLTTASAKPTTLAPSQTVPTTVNQITCAKCKVVYHTTGPSPVGRNQRCPRCAAVFAVTADRCRQVPAKPPVPAAKQQAGSPTKPPASPVPTAKPPAAKPEPAKPQAAKQTKLVAAAPAPPAKPPIASPAKKTVLAAGPAFAYTCPGCAAVLKSATQVPVGKQIKCPRCQRVFAAPQATGGKPAVQPRPQPVTKTTTLAKQPAAKPTTLAKPPVQPMPAAAKTTTLAKPPAAKPTTLAKAPGAKPTTLAPPPKQPAAAPAQRPIVRIPCPGCKSVLKLVGTPPADAALKCPRCGRGLRVQSRSKPQPTTQIKPQAGRGKPQVVQAKQQAAAKSQPAPATPKAAVAKPQGVPAGAPAKPQAAVAKPKPAVKKPAPAKTQAAPATPPPAPAKPREILPILYLVGMFAIAFAFVAFYTYNKGWWGHGIPSSAWTMFAPPDGRCQIMMPGSPTSSPAAVHGDGIISGQRYMVERTAEDAVFFLIISDRDAKVTAGKSFQELYGPVHNYILGYHPDGQVLSEEDISLGEHSGKEMQMRLATGDILVARVFLVRGKPFDRLYILIAAGPWTDPRRGDPAKFFDSFKLESAQPVIRPGKEKRRVRVA